MSTNLSDMLERLNEEQNQLSRRVEEREREKAFWDRRVAAKRMLLDKVKADLNKNKKEGIVVEDELRMKVSQQKLLVGDLEGEEQATPVFGIKQKTEKLEEIKRRVEKLEASRKYFQEERKEIDSSWNTYVLSVKRVENSSGLGKELMGVKRTGKVLKEKFQEMIDKDGSIDSLEVDTGSLTMEVNHIFEEKWQGEEEGQMYQQVIRERKGIISRMEIEARMGENRLLAQKRRLTNMLDSLKAAEGGRKTA